jgi:chromosome segregation ATPase
MLLLSLLALQPIFSLTESEAVELTQILSSLEESSNSTKSSILNLQNYQTDLANKLAISLSTAQSLELRMSSYEAKLLEHDKTLLSWSQASEELVTLPEELRVLQETYNSNQQLSTQALSDLESSFKSMQRQLWWYKLMATGGIAMAAAGLIVLLCVAT